VRETADRRRRSSGALRQLGMGYGAAAATYLLGRASAPASAECQIPVVALRRLNVQKSACRRVDRTSSCATSRLGAQQSHAMRVGVGAVQTGGERAWWVDPQHDCREPQGE
jgi:hypothetical protein